MSTNRISALEAMERETDRFDAFQGFYRDPAKWIGKWMLGRVVYLLYIAIPIVLYFWDDYIFIPWRDK